MPNENNALTLFKKAWKVRFGPCDVTKTHGSVYQSGLPDLFVMCSTHKQMVMVEMKVGKPRSLAALLNKCRPMQRRFMLAAARYQCKAFVVCWSKKDDLWSGFEARDLLDADLTDHLEWVPLEAVLDFMHMHLTEES